MLRYLADRPAIGPLWYHIRADDTAVERRMIQTEVYRIVSRLGQDVLGIDDLGPHDLRHTWATLAAKNGTDITNLRQAGGWNSLTMPARYLDENTVANEGVILRKKSNAS